MLCFWVMSSKSRKLSDQIREAMARSGMTRYRISQLTGIDQATLSRFFHGTGGLAMDKLDRLGEVLGLDVVCRKPRKPR